MNEITHTHAFAWRGGFVQSFSETLRASARDDVAALHLCGVCARTPFSRTIFRSAAVPVPARLADGERNSISFGRRLIVSPLSWAACLVAHTWNSCCAKFMQHTRGASPIACMGPHVHVQLSALPFARAAVPGRHASTSEFVCRPRPERADCQFKENSNGD